MDSQVCGFCSKERGTLNLTNWNRHIQACKNKKIKVNSSFNIKHFFTSTCTKGMYLLLLYFIVSNLFLN